ncbi:MAG: BNR/Asp-box repeat protein [Verrucomicrobiales bacterium]|nr:BNR/Asp-box repeat protein [Verrucomicrobiales bacterium]
MQTHHYRTRPGFFSVIALLICCLNFIQTPAAQAAEDWKDITSPLLGRLTNSGAKLGYPGGCSGVVVNRTNGDVTIKVVGLGLWRSSDQGNEWKQIDDKTISGRDETAWATSADQNSPGRMVSFSLDGSAGWTTDGIHWKKFTTLGRNWDFGSVDWASPDPKTIIAAKHETNPPGEVYVTQDGGVTWKQLAIHVNSNRDKISMVGTMTATTFIYSKGGGIERSQDGGVSWTKVSDANPQTRIPVLFAGKHYLGSTNGLLVSRDLGANWKEQGTAVNIWQGPFFGRDEKEILVVGKDGIFVTRNGAENWKRVAALKKKESGFLFIPNWFGCYAWDPVNNILYVSAMGNPVYKLQL